jgi:hypothetical protein
MMIDYGNGVNATARELGLPAMTVSRINKDRMKAYAVLEKWHAHK